LNEERVTDVDPRGFLQQETVEQRASGEVAAQDEVERDAVTGGEASLPGEGERDLTCADLAKRQNFDSVVDTSRHSFAQAVQVFGVPHRRIAFHRVQAIEDGFLYLGVPGLQAVGQQSSRLPPRGATG